jgi:5'-deoxynucleotidase YfbR-like HD superfamily hydrolase
MYERLYGQYEERESVEARIVKAADIIDLLIQAFALERAGAKGLDEFWSVARDADFRLPTKAEAIVNRLINALLTAREQIA